MRPRPCLEYERPAADFFKAARQTRGRYPPSIAREGAAQCMTAESRFHADGSAHLSTLEVGQRLR